MTPVEFHFDVVSPNAYLCHKLLPAVEARTGVRFAYVPILLGGLFKLANNRPPFQTYAEIPNKLAYEKLEIRRFVAQHGLNAFRMNPHFPLNTVTVMRAACAAQTLGTFGPYVDAMYAAMWERGLNLADEAVFLQVLADAGLDGPAHLAAAQDGEVKARLLANTQRSYERGAFGAPSFFVGDDLYFGKDRLRDVEEAIRRKGVGTGGDGSGG